MKVADRAYLAGLVDGEGSICIIKKSRDNLYSVFVTITSTDKPVLDWITATTGIGKTYRNTRQVNHPVWSWTVGGNEAAMKLLKLITPYLKIKRAQAELALQFPIWGKPGVSMPLDFGEKRKELSDKVRALNHSVRNANNG